MLISELFDKIRSRPSRSPHIQSFFPGDWESRIAANRHYFGVHIRELFLAESGRWWTDYEPMVFVATEFLYDKARITVPFVVGPSLIKANAKDGLPKGMQIQDTQVAGWAPFRGGKIALTVILYRVKRVDYAQRLLRVVESVSRSLSFGAAVGSYVNVSASIVEGVEALLSLGDTEPLAGQRIEFDSEMDEGFRRGHVAVLNSSEFVDAKDRFSVQENRLKYASAAGSKVSEFRLCDYALYSISRVDRREDVRQLPFYSLVEEVNKSALSGSTEDREVVKAALLTLYREMVLSPDLTTEHADVLFSEYMATVKKLHAVTESAGTLDVDAERQHSDAHRKLRSAIQTIGALT